MSVKGSGGRTATKAHLKQRSSSIERRSPGTVRSRTPSPSGTPTGLLSSSLSQLDCYHQGFKSARFDPTAYVQSKKSKQKETKLVVH